MYGQYENTNKYTNVLYLIASYMQGTPISVSSTSIETSHKHHPAKWGGQRSSEYRATYPPKFTSINMLVLRASRPESTFIPLAARRARWHVTTTGCPAQPHTSQNAPIFRNTVPPCGCLRSAPYVSVASRISQPLLSQQGH